MQSKNIHVGGVYYSKVNGKLQKVTVLRVIESYGNRLRYEVRNHATGRRVWKSGRQLRESALDTAPKQRPRKQSDKPIKLGIVGDVMMDVLTGNQLKYVAGLHIACPQCGRILDWKTTVDDNDRVRCLDCYIKTFNATAEKFPSWNPEKYLADQKIVSAHNLHVRNRRLEAGAMALMDI